MNYRPDKETTFEKRPQTAEENLLKKMISNEEHVLCQFLTPVKEDKQCLRPRAQCSQLPIKDDANFIPRIFYSTLKYPVNIVTYTLKLA